MAKLKKLLTVQVGKARATDDVLDLKVSKTLLKKLKKLSTDGVLEISEVELMASLGLQISGALSEGIQIEGVVQNFEKKSALDTAKEIIYGDREEAYGNPRFNLDSIAQFWSTYLGRKFPGVLEEFKLSAEDVAQFMILLKMARLIHNPTHFDSITDQIGYAALQDRIQGM